MRLQEKIRQIYIVLVEDQLLVTLGLQLPKNEIHTCSIMLPNQFACAYSFCCFLVSNADGDRRTASRIQRDDDLYC